MRRGETESSVSGGVRWVLFSVSEASLPVASCFRTSLYQPPHSDFTISPLTKPNYQVSQALGANQAAAPLMRVDGGYTGVCEVKSHRIYQKAMVSFQNRKLQS